MDKEYLSLMAELGEAPVPAPGGGHNNPSSGPRGTGPNSNQPPPVSTPGLFCSVSPPLSGSQVLDKCGSEL